MQPGAQLSTPWPAEFNAMVYVLSGAGTVGSEGRPLVEGQLAVLGHGDAIAVTAGDRQDNRTGALEVLLLGGKPIGERVVQYGPFVMNDQTEILDAMRDFHAGRMGSIPAEHLTGKRLGA
ncbi:MAG: pirin-like C-terminal cupin domain-containing protein [Thermocrispum sp.]